MTTSFLENMDTFLYSGQAALGTYGPDMCVIHLLAFNFISLSLKTNVLPFWC